jgi:predicted molibdopterin-dependent oxidoreductase YjgC
MNDSRFRPLEAEERDTVEFEFDGHRVRAPRGISVAAALLRAGISRCRDTPSGAPRGPYCLMGVCFECIVEVEGMGACQACMLEVADGLRLKPAGLP